MKRDFDELGLPGARYHVFMCAGPECCSEQDGDEAWQHLKKAVKKHDLSVLRTRVDCLRLCKDGPWLVVYPDGVWYDRVTPERFDRIRREHLEQGVPVAEWVRAVQPLRRL